MKNIIISLLLICSLVLIAQAQQPQIILELRHDKLPSRKIFVYSNGSYQLFINPGEAPIVGTAEFLKAPPNIIHFNVSVSGADSYSFTVRGNASDWTGDLTNGVRTRQGITESFTITDRTKSGAPKK
jgi:hypothetical protein